MSIALIELTYGATQLWSSDGRLRSRFLKGWPGETPMVRGEDDTIAAVAGRSYYPRVADHLDIGLHLDVVEETEATYRSAITALLALFDATAAPATLTAILEDGATATIDAYVLPPVLIREQVPSLVAELEVALVSIDPSWVIVPAGS